MQEWDGRRVHVSRIIDGDTVEVLQLDPPYRPVVVRLWGIDAPEMRGCPRGPCHGALEATMALRALTWDTVVRLELEQHQTRCRYGRLMAHVWTDDRSLNLSGWLIDEGWAFADHRYPHAYRLVYSDRMLDARRQGKGLWSGVPPDELPGWLNLDP